ncbi:hypothetical protein [Aeromonas jandaei]
MTNEQREQVITLRRTHSLSEVAFLAGLSLGTVKAIVSRSGLFTDNPRHRAMFTLPPLQSSGETLPAVPELPPQEVVTGDKEIDALLWLRQVIGTGDPARIAKAKEAAGRITTPLCELEQRYGKWLVAKAGHMLAGLGSIGFANLDGLAERAITRRANEAEAIGRLGDALWDDTQGYYENSQEAHARDWFVFGLLAELRPRNREEARATLRYLMGSERDDAPEAERILNNLVG